MAYDDIQDQKNKVDKLSKAFDAEKNIGRKLQLLNLWLAESNKLDKMEDEYLREEKGLTKIVEVVYAG